MGVPERKEMKRHRRHNLKERFEILKTLGQGTYGKVKLSVEKVSGVQYAIKSIRKKRIQTEQDLVRVRREIEIMATLHHPHIVTVHEVFENKERIVLVMDYACGGELYDFINERKGLYEDQARKFFRQIVSAVYYLHVNGIVHRDLKLENILLDGFGNVKIADFGLSNVYGADKLLNTFCGSPLYASPEIVNGHPYYGPEVDCWSLGVVLYTLVYGAMPFDGSDFKRLKQQITEGDYFEPKNPSDASGLIKQLLCPNASKRATVEDICVHWWVNFGFEKSPADLAELSSTVDRNSLVQTLKSGYTSDSDYENVDTASHSKQTSRPLKGILKKPRESESSQCNGEHVEASPLQVNGFPEREYDKLKKPRSNCELNNEWLGYPATEVADNVSCSGTNTVENRRSAPVSCDNTKAVFDSSKKPKKSILKNKSGNSRSDSGCIIDEQMNIYAALEKFQVEYPENERVRRAESQRDSAYIERKQSCEGGETNDSHIYDLNDIESVLDDIVNFKVATEKRLANSSGVDGSDNIFCNVSENRSPPTIIVPLKDYSDYDPMKEPVRYRNKSHNKPLKSILKRNSRSKENSWRYSLGSQGSNSSGDILDFSYDSADGESFMQEFCAVPIPLTDEEERLTNGHQQLDSASTREQSFVESLQEPWSNFDVLQWQDVDAPLNDSLTKAKEGGEEEEEEYKETDILDDLNTSEENAEGEGCARSDLKMNELNGQVINRDTHEEDLEMAEIFHESQCCIASENPPPLPERPPPIGAPASPVKFHTTPPPTPPPPLPETPPPPFKAFELDVFDMDMYGLDEATNVNKNDVILNGGSESMSNNDLDSNLDDIQSIDYDKVFDAIEEQTKEALDSLDSPSGSDKPNSSALDKDILAQMQRYFLSEEPVIDHFTRRGKSKSRSAQAIPETEKLGRPSESTSLSKELHDTLDFYNLELRRSFENIKLHISEDDLVQFYKVSISPQVDIKHEQQSHSASASDVEVKQSLALYVDSEETDGDVANESLAQSSKEDISRMGVELVDLFIEEDTMQHNLSDLAQHTPHSELNKVADDSCGEHNSLMAESWCRLMDSSHLPHNENLDFHCVQLIDLGTDQSSSDISDTEVKPTGAFYSQKNPCDLHISEDLLSAIPLMSSGHAPLPPNGLDVTTHELRDITQSNQKPEDVSGEITSIASVPDLGNNHSAHYLDDIMEKIDQLGEELDNELKFCEKNMPNNCSGDLVDFDEAFEVCIQGINDETDSV